ncbi:MAG TPA: protein kinase [Cyclobacteriaceae bacterium]|jgi:serine/threonine-protein kinase|nr:protein kinase [Cyclobacteriaceae bacterium]
MNQSTVSTKIVLRNDAVIYDPQLAGEIISPEKHIFLRCNGDVVTITPLMKDILEQARTPQTKEELAAWLSIQQHCPYDKIYPSVETFLRRMMKFGAVVKEQDSAPPDANIFDKIDQAKKIDDFILSDLIGKNRSVAIYKCHREGIPVQLFSMKVLIANESKKDFFKEADILTSMPYHPNVRRCFKSAVSQDNVPYLLLDYVDGSSISDSLIKRETPLHIKYRIASEVMSGIEHLHKHHVLHGDIHASNFLVDPDHHVHLIDLGMAFYENEDTHHGGIPRYMPPERMPDHSYSFSKMKGDYVSEVFQVGICLYLLMSGSYPFDGLLLKDLAKAIKNELPAPLTETSMHEPIPTEISDVIFKAMAKDRNDRYQSVGEMLHEWNKITNNLKNGFAILQPVHGR